MTRITLALAVFALLALTLALGAALHWAWLRLGRAPASAEARLAETLEALHAAEAALAAAQRRAEAAETAAAEAAATARATVEAELAEARAERAAAMEAIGDARRQAAEWRAAYERFAAGR